MPLDVRRVQIVSRDRSDRARAARRLIVFGGMVVAPLPILLHDKRGCVEPILRVRPAISRQSVLANNALRTSVSFREAADIEKHPSAQA